MMTKYSVLLVILLSGTVFALANPSAVYCSEMNKDFGNYTYIVQADANSNEYGICILPDGTQCDAWDFLDGKCGNDLSYCVRNGYNITMITNGNSEYAACIVNSSTAVAMASPRISRKQI